MKIFARYYFGNRYETLSDKITYRLKKQLQEEDISGRDINNGLMDFGALVSTSIDKIDAENYPLKNCLWFTTTGSKEPLKKKTMRRSEK
ncbi:hypothetical protein H6768_05150 [Candidatus Peribacteria bacterium]|nr:hypothetical protein [Candidatus Peribacteria bacterium]